MLQRLKDFNIGIKDQEILDIGTANGLFARDLARNGCKVIGIDISAELIEQAKQINKGEGLPIEYLVENVEKLPFPDSTYKIVTAVYCWHWFDKLKVAKEVNRVLEDKGKLVIINYEWISTQNRIAEYTKKLINEFNPNAKKGNETGIFPEWIENIYLAGFSNVETFSFDVQENYSIDDWIGRIQASPEIGGSLDKEQIKLFNEKLRGFIRNEQTKGSFEIPYRVFAIVGDK